MPTPSRTEFLDEVAQFVGRRFPLVKLERNKEEFALRVNGCWISLENLYRLSIGNPDHFETLVERWVVELLRVAEGSPDQKASFDELRPRILPMLLSRGPRDMGGMAMVTQDLLEDLRVGYAVDSERTIAYIPKKVFETWKVTLDDLHEAAIQNLVARSEQMEAQAAQDELGRINLVLIQTMDGYDASRILLPSLHERLREHLGSPFLAGVPNRDILLCFRNEPEMVTQMSRQIAHDYRTMPHQVSERLFLVTADGLADYEPVGV